VEETLGQTFLGAPVGALVFAAAAAAPFLIGTAGFVMAALLILGMRGDFRPQRTQPPASVRDDIRDGVRWLSRHRLLRGLTLISALTAFTESMATGVLVLYVLEVLRLPTGDYGAIMVAGGVGALIGGVATPWLAARLGRVAVLTGGAVVCAVPLLLMGFTHDGLVAAFLIGVSSAGVMAWNVLTMSLRQALIPAELFGRVQGAYRTVVWGAIPVGSLAGGVIAKLAGLSRVFVVVGSVQLALSGVLLVLLLRNASELGSPQGGGEGALGRGHGGAGADEGDRGLDLGRQEPIGARPRDAFT
jgi:Na+/melibiose symporter-like transporter